jgi:hypothetical protein
MVSERRYTSVKPRLVFQGRSSNLYDLDDGEYGRRRTTTNQYITLHVLLCKDLGALDQEVSELKIPSTTVPFTSECRLFFRYDFKGTPLSSDDICLQVACQTWHRGLPNLPRPCLYHGVLPAGSL